MEILQIADGQTANSHAYRFPNYGNRRLNIVEECQVSFFKQVKSIFNQFI